MAKIIHLENEPYLLTIPAGEKGNTHCDWEKLVAALDEKNDILHWFKMYFFVDVPDYEPMICGFNRASYYGDLSRTTRVDYLGFRPALIPLTCDDPAAVSTTFRNIPDGTIIKSGVLTMFGETAVPIPKSPREGGDTVKYQLGAELTIRDADLFESEYEITWLVVNGKLVADRCLLCGISLEDLQKEGIVEGEKA